MTKTEFVKLIDDGSDIMFDVLDRHFTIITWLDDGIGIGEQNKDDSVKIFADAEDLISKFEIDGKLLAEVIKKVQITQYS